MIPTGSDHMIRRALGYMDAKKVGQWARTMICPNITDRDIIRIQRSMSAPRRIGSAKDTALGPYTPHAGLVDDGALGRRIDAHIAARSKECGVHPDFYRRVLGWR